MGKKLINSYGSKFKITYHEINLVIIKNSVRSFFNSFANYLRLFIPEYSQSEICIYSDSDVIFREDVANMLINYDDSVILGLVRKGQCKNRQPWESGIIQKYKNLNDAYFCSAIAVLNNKLYKKNDISNQCIAICKNHGESLKLADQTVWNCMPCDIAELDEKWSLSVSRTDPARFAESGESGGILHFIGSPKPWDLFAEFFHPSASLWENQAKASGLRSQKLLKYIDLSMWKRFFRIRRQYSHWFG